MSIDHRTEAIRLLTHYLRVPMEKAGLKWTGDCDTEVEAIVDSVLKAATAHTIQELQRIAPFGGRAPGPASSVGKPSGWPMP